MINLNTKITGSGSYLPEKILTNEELSKSVDTSDEWIVQRSGIKSRHIARQDETAASMGAIAAKRALYNAGLQATDIDLIVVATCSASTIFPATACLIQKELGIPICPALDVQAACSGFIYGLATVDSFIKVGLATKALLVGTEVMSRVVDWTDRSTCVLFGDGAGAVILESSSSSDILSYVHIAADGRHKDLLYLNNATATPKCSEIDLYLQMNGNPLFKLAVKLLEKEAKDCLVKNGLTSNDIDWVVPHQANLRIINSTLKKLGIANDKVAITVDKHANTSGASIPLALDAFIASKKIQRNQTLLLEAFGGGLTWGSALIKYA